MAVQVAGEQLGTGAVDERTILDGAVKLVDLNSEVTARLTPDLSGHSDGQILTIVTGAPEWANPAAASVRLDQVLDPTAAKTFSMTTYPLAFTYTVPTNAPAFSIHTTGNIGTGALHVHQSAGTPSVPVDLVYFEGAHKDVLPLRIVSLNQYAIAVDQIIQINIASGPVTPLALSAACTAKVTYLNADQVDGADASATPTASTIPIANGSGKLVAGWGGSASCLATLDANVVVVEAVRKVQALANPGPASPVEGEIWVDTDLYTLWYYDTDAGKVQLPQLNASSLVVQNPATAAYNAAQNAIPIGYNAAAPFLKKEWFSPQTTKGDLVVYSTAPIRLAVGTNDYCFIADSAQTAGVKWGVLAIAGGGTGQVTQTAAFDALAPCTTKGDIIVYNGSNNIRLAVGADDYIMTADSTTASGLVWKRPEVLSAVLTSSRSNNTTSFADATGLSVDVPATGYYHFKATVTFYTAATTTGIGLAMNGPTATGQAIRICIPTTGVQGTDSEMVENVNAWDTGTATTGIDAATTRRVAILEGSFYASATGTLIVRFKSEVASSYVYVLQGSCLELWLS